MPAIQFPQSFRSLVVLAATAALLVQRAAGQTDPHELLKKADAALRAAHAVSYEAEGEDAIGLKLRGKVTLVQNPAASVPKLRFDATIAPPGVAPFDFVVVCDGSTVTALNYATRLYAREPVPAGLRWLDQTVPLVVREFVAEAPLDDELKAPKVELGGKDTVGGVDCTIVVANFGKEDLEVRWAIGDKDFLPRAVERTFADERGHKTVIKTTLRDLKTGIKPDDAIFTQSIPPGFSDLKVAASQAAADPGPLAGKPAPAFSLKDQDGKPVSPADLRGKSVVLAFWATWDKDCERAFAFMQKVADLARDKPLAFYAVNCFERQRKLNVVGVIRQKNFTFNILVNGDAAGRDYRVKDLPTFVLISPDGQVILSRLVRKEDDEAALLDAIRTSLKP